MTVTKYANRFSGLEKYASTTIKNTISRIQRFLRGFQARIKGKLLIAQPKTSEKYIRRA